ncbi:SSS family solute:Na+ symporter [Bacillus thermophilus]|uniref:SSS family solute:Na+ symporter n=1 Tax=Siminovitchia thermophila TaxID=1245522 RepID=A0ABS2R5F5_9BACI|nr:sodium:solute symporter family protein [Siminovitchia thermophila]MBM7714867.1 SSS family solute:Na+ symporter [Siminovitchia thermophila]
MNVHLIIVIVYLTSMVFLGMYFAKREVKNTEDFMIAGRRLPGFILVGTLLATWVGSGTIVGGASFIFQYGPLASIIYFAGGPIGIMILYFIADKARLLKKNTLPEMLENRYGSTTRLVATVFILLAYVGITAYQFIGGGVILSMTTDISPETGTILIAVFVIFLAVTGGLFSVSYTDFVSAILIVFGFLIAVPFLLPKVDGFSGMVSALPDSHVSWSGGLTFPQLLGFFLPTFLLILGDQNMYNRFSAARDEITAKKSTIGFFFGNVIIISLAIFIATTAVVLYPEIQSDTSIFHIAANAVPVPVGSLILVASIALVITTANSFLLSIAGNIVYDIYSRFKGTLTDRQHLRFSRMSVILLGILAYVLGTFFPSVLEVQMYSYTMYGAAITPVVMATFFWKRANTAGALASIITGGMATLFWELVLNKPFDWNSVLFSLPLSVAALIIITLLTSKKKDIASMDTDSTIVHQANDKLPGGR